MAIDHDRRLSARTKAGGRYVDVQAMNGWGRGSSKWSPGVEFAWRRCCECAQGCSSCLVGQLLKYGVKYCGLQHCAISDGAR